MQAALPPSAFGTSGPAGALDKSLKHDLRYLLELPLNDQTLCIGRVFFGRPEGESAGNAIAGDPTYALAFLWELVEATSIDPAATVLCDLYNDLAWLHFCSND